MADRVLSDLLCVTNYRILTVCHFFMSLYLTVCVNMRKLPEKMLQRARVQRLHTAKMLEIATVIVQLV